MYYLWKRIADILKINSLSTIKLHSQEIPWKVTIDIWMIRSSWILTEAWMSNTNT